MFYLFINMTIPDFFNDLTSAAIGGQSKEWLCYNFAPLTTLGYDVLTPNKPFPRTVANIKKNVEQLSVAVLVA